MNRPLGAQVVDGASYSLPFRETPYFIASRKRIIAAYRGFESYFPGAAIYYAMKANSEPGVLRTLVAAGAGFEIASAHELRLLARLSVPPVKIIYGSSIKPIAHVKECHEYGIDRFAADSFLEVERIAAAAPNARIYIRARVDDAGSVFQFSEKFGAEIASIVPMLQLATARGLRPYGISFHVGSQASNAAAWANALSALAPALHGLRDAGIGIEVLNLGGGYPYRYPSARDAPDLECIATSITAALERLPYRPALILEPGRAVIADAVILVTSVIARVERKGVNWLFLDAGVYNALHETLAFQGSTQYRVTPIRASADCQQLRFALAGPTGDSPDVIMRDALLPSDTRVGDRLIFHGVGAYSLSVASRFNGFPKPPVYFLEHVASRARVMR